MKSKTRMVYAHRHHLATVFVTDCGFDFGAGVVVAVVMAMVSGGESYAMVMVTLDYGHDGHSDDHRAQ